MDDENELNDETIADADLVLRTRSGDAAAFGELWRRHYPSGMSVARSITSSIDPDDLVQESYTRIYQAIIKGGGPNGSFRAYLFTSIRNTAAAWGRSRRESAMDELDTVADPGSTDQAANEALDRSLTAQAFRSLPSRWQEVLWYTEIEQMKPQEAGALLGMKAGAVSQLAFRAREGLREAWIQAHLRSAAPGSECQWTIEHLGAYSRGNLSTRDHKRLETHLDECARCMIVAAEAKDVSQRLALVLLPLVLGVTGASGYLATLQGGGTPLAALAAMPSGVIEGGVVVGTGAASAATSVTSGGGAGGAGSSGAGAGVSGGILSGVGALVGVGSAALIVAGVVAAAAILPGLAGANPATSLPNAGESGSSSIATDIAPDDSMTSDAPAAPPVVDPAPPVPPASDPVPVETQSAPDVVAPPVVPEKPVEPVKPVDPKPPVEPEKPKPGLPEGIPTVGTAEVQCTWDLGTVIFPVTRIVVSVTGAPGATVQPVLGGDTARTSSGLLDEAGAGTVELRPSAGQLFENVSVVFQYTFIDDLGEVHKGLTTEPVTLSDLTGGTEWGCAFADVPAPTDPAPTDPAPTDPVAPAVDPAPESIVTAPADPAADPATPTAPASDAPAPVEPAAPTEPAALTEPIAPVEPVALTLNVSVPTEPADAAIDVVTDAAAPAE
ncbi:MAG: sigma-70 family RNA polymerase sigma factor [Microbacterium sp.]|nr:sigma-70 family RNA polymerase sigma factor [Microbacterium sp.]